MITFKKSLEIHSVLIDRFGGRLGVRDHSLLEFALNRPYQTAAGKELYPTAIEKAAALLESIVKNYPFIDGNKRAGYVLARLILLESGRDIMAEPDEKYYFIIQVSKGQLDLEQIYQWLRQHLK